MTDRTQGTVTIAAWNVARGLSDEERYQDIQSGIEQLDADVVVLSEARNNKAELVNPDYAAALGYTAITLPYVDATPHSSGEQYISMLSRIELTPTIVRLETRNAVHATITDSRLEAPLEFFGLHSDDRTAAASNGARMRMARALALLTDGMGRAVVAGDLNNIHAGDTVARILRSGPVRKAAQIAPHPRVRSLATRLTEMAAGDALQTLTDAGLRDADPLHQPTMKKAGLGFAVDHILHSSLVHASNFKNLQLPGSDHRAISASIR